VEWFAEGGCPPHTPGVDILILYAIDYRDVFGELRAGIVSSFRATVD
jgi:hypothetical protein